MKTERQNHILTILNDCQKNAVEQLDSDSAVLLPVKSFSSGAGYYCIRVLYISDIHLDYHLQNSKIVFSDSEAVLSYLDSLIEQMLGDEERIFICDYPPNDDYCFEELVEKYGKQKAYDLDDQIYSEEDLDKSNLPQFLHHCVIFNGDISGSIKLTELFFNRFFKKLGDSDHCRIFVVLGNHEYSEFENEEKAVAAYKELLSQYDVSVLNNEIIEYENCFVLGGTGFAKYNDNYNADNLVCSKRMQGNRNVEAEESEKLEIQYKKALEQAEMTHKPILVFSHYPVRDWLQETLSDHCFYFFGHNHINDVFITNRFNIYADNQIGYKNHNIKFKEILILQKNGILIKTGILVLRTLPRDLIKKFGGCYHMMIPIQEDIGILSGKHELQTDVKRVEAVHSCQIRKLKEASMI